jgi:arabinofuranosyltransferase
MLPLPAQPPRFPWISFAVLAALLVLHARLFFDFQVDDAFIVLRYADNLRRGLGLTFNPGERIEGFTCPLLVFIEAGFMAVHVNPFVATKILGVLCGVAMLGLTIRLALDLTRSTPAALFAGAVLVLQSPLAMACVNGLETVLFAACVTAALALHLAARTRRRYLAVSLLLALAVFLRPEGALALALIGADVLWRQPTWRERWRAMVALLLPFGIVVTPLYAWKVSYFSSLTPNTALAKLPAQSAGRFASGLQYLLDYSWTHWELLAYLSLAVLALRHVARFRTLAWFAFVWLGWVVFAGGDWIPRGRFIVPVLPIIAVSLAGGVQACVGWLGERTRWVGFALALLPLLGSSGMELGPNSRWVDETTQGMVRGRTPLARWLRSAAAPGSTVAMLDVGAAAFYSQQRLIDIGGLTDRPIAQLIHDSTGDYVGHLFFPDAAGAETIARNTLARRPEFVVVMLFGELPKLLDAVREARGRGEQVLLAGAYPQDQALVNAPELRRDYRWICSNLITTAANGNEARYNVFVRKDVALRNEPVRDSAGHIVCQ